MKRTLSVAVLALMLCGCETYRYEYAPCISTSPQTRQRYSLRECVFSYGFKVGGERCERRDTFQTESFSRDELDEMAAMYPDVFADNGIPVSINLCRDLDKSGSGVFLSFISSIFYLGTIGIVPGVFMSDNVVAVEVIAGDAKRSSYGFEMKEFKRQTFASSGLNLLFPYGSPSGREYSQAGSASLLTKGERCSWSIGMGVDRRCRKAAYAFAIAAALTELERESGRAGQTSNDAGGEDLGGSQMQAGPIGVCEEPEGKTPGSESVNAIEIDEIPL